MTGILRQPRASFDPNGPSTIDRLEESAARLSISSRPDLEARQQAPSRRSSARSTMSISHAASSSTHSSLRPAPLSLNGPDGRHASQSITPLSPAGAVGSPLESTRSSRSFSWSQASARPSRANSRITHSTPFQEPEQEGRPLDSMLSRTDTTYSKSGTINSHRTPFPRLDVSYPDSAQGNKSALSPADVSSRQTAPTRSASTASKASTIQTTRSLFRDFDGTHYTNIAGEIAEEDEDDEAEHEASSLLKPDEYDDNDDDDDEHFAEHVDRSPATSPDNTSDHESSFIPVEKGTSGDEQHDMIDDPYERQPLEQHTPARPPTWAVPPPDEHMVYYPAPVPMNLNLPKRLSRQSPAVLQAQRRSQVLGAMDVEARRSAPWLPTDMPVPEGTEPASRENKRKTVNLQKLPPQLRASVFFDPQPIQHDIEIHQGSAVLSLERMLDASAQTPVGVPATVSTMRVQRSLSTIFNDERVALRKSRSSLLLGQQQSNENFVAPMRPDFGRSLSGLAMYKDDREAIKKDLADHESAGDSPVPAKSPDAGGGDDDDYVHVTNGVDSDSRRANNEDDFDEERPITFNDGQRPGAPTTLLAELQLRKEELKARRRTAAPAYHTGMHSTLLELDAVAQVERRRRGNRPTQLAWEGSEDLSFKAHQDDDDTPLGLLFPARNALIHKVGEQTLGLIEQRAIDDNEPLSRRRDRLLGVESPPQPQHERNQSRGSVPIIGVFPHEPVEEEKEETLAQRTRRLRSSRLLDEAIGLESGRHARAISDDFASEMMSQLGVDASPKRSSGANTPDAEETLGQRKRRLQAGRQASGNTSSSAAQQHRREIHPSASLSNILGAAPVGAMRQNTAPNINRGQTGLLGASDLELTARRQHLADRNMRSASHAGFGGPLVNAPFTNKQPILRGEMSRERLRLGPYNDSAGSTSDFSRAMSPAFHPELGRKRSAMSLGISNHIGSNQTSHNHGYQPQQWQHAAGYGISNGAPTMSPLMQPGYAFAPSPQSQYWQQQMYPTMVPPLNINTTVTPGMSMDYREGGMSPEQRTNIDRWRQSVMP